MIVVDANDNSPVLDAGHYYNTTIVNDMKENGVVVAVLNATDSDSGGAALLDFSITGQTSMPSGV